MKSRRVMHVVLTISLILNILVAGLVAGAVWRWQRGDLGRLGASRQAGHLLAAADVLQPEHRRAYRQALRAVRYSSQDLIATARTARREAAAAFLADEFDQRAVARALARARAADFTLRARAEAAVLDVTAGLPASERQRLGDALKRSGPFQQSVQKSKLDTR